LDDAVADAFDGARIEVTGDRGYLDLEMRQRGLLRSLRAAELSDGTLRYLLLVSALLSPRPPTLMILNEPETSLHPDLLGPLARLVAAAASKSQIFVVTHASMFADPLSAIADCRLFVLGKEFGETAIADAERPAWTWPSR
jgi:predicted ATPase